ncbi:MAG TPA: IS21 family transposase [Acidobacteriaceae bacterium]|jgi:transposase|nr:IS21 family transposase [Acidobacteriaceae bacterium]
MINSQQRIRLVTEFQRTGSIGMSALKSGMDRKTARKYLAHPELLSQPRPTRDWRTRPDTLTVIWPEAELRLSTAPELEAKALFEHLLLVRPEQAQVAQLRTFQRRVRQWRLEHGPAPEVIFPQTHSPGEVMQVDWTHAKELRVSIAGHPLDHLLCQAVLPYSNWQWATRCQSESLLSLRAGLQAALFQLGKAPKLLQIDNSSAATHQISGEGKRDFNPDFLSLVAHYGLAARTIHVGCPNENGDVESHNGHLKRRLEQHLLLRGTRDFVNETAYDQFVVEVLAKANNQRRTKIAEELAVMRELPPTRLCEYDEVECRVCSHSTIRVKRVAYSVPARFIGRRLRARVYEQHLEVYHGAERIAQITRAPGRQAVIDYRHVIQALLRKPGAFARYHYREELFPSSTYRRAYDRLVQDHGPGPGELEYLRLLKLTAELGSSAIEGLLSEMLGVGTPPWRTATLRSLLCPSPRVELMEPAVDLSVYDALLREEALYVA